MEEGVQNSYTIEEIRKKVEIIPQVDGGTISRFVDETGMIQSKVYYPFPGTKLVSKSVQLPYFLSNWCYEPTRALFVEYCREGNLEIQIDEKCLFVSKGDVVVHRMDPYVRELRYPSQHYRADLFVIFLDGYSSVLDMHLNMLGCSIERLMEYYLPQGEYFTVLKDDEYLQPLFEHLFHVQESVKVMCFGLKLLECLLILGANIPKEKAKSSNRTTKVSADVSRQIFQYVMEHADKRLTIAELAKEFSISQTQLKTYFRAAYGVPVQSFIREQKIKAAAKVLERSDLQITTVAQMFGYSNISKFASAFKQVMGETPKQYTMKAERLLKDEMDE